MENNVIEQFQMEVAHVGLNASHAGEAGAWADQFFSLFGLQKRETPKSYFSGSLVEIMKENGRGTHGHIGFKVNNCEKAMEYFLSNGLTVAEETKKFDENGTCIFVYFNEEIGGFAVHLIQG